MIINKVAQNVETIIAVDTAKNSFQVLVVKMCICIPQCWYCDFVTSFEFVDDYIDSLITNDDGICDFDSIIVSDMYLDGEFQGSFDGIFKFFADDYIDFEKEVEQLRKDPYVNDIFDEYEPLPSYLRMSNC